MSHFKQLLEDGLIWFGNERTQPPLNTYQRPASEGPINEGPDSDRPAGDRPANEKSAQARFGIPQIDNSLPQGGIEFGRIHEWALVNQLSSQARYIWYPPVSIVTALVSETIFAKENSIYASSKNLNRTVIAWVGRRCWPTPDLLQTTLGRRELNNLAFKANENWSWKKNCLFIDPSSKSKRLWTISHLLRSSFVLAVIADGSGLNLLATRRLQFAARTGGALGILLRPPWELAQQSAASTKWQVTPVSSENDNPLWSLELLRGKGLGSPLAWFVEWNEDESDEKSSLNYVEPRDVERRDAEHGDREGLQDILAVRTSKSVATGS